MRVVPVCIVVALLALAGYAAFGSGDDAPAGPTGTLTVFAATPLRASFEEIAKRFEDARPGAKVVLKSGSSRAFFDRMGRDASATADLFATSDMTVTHDLTGNDELGGNLEAGDSQTQPQIFVYDHLAIVTRPGNPLKVAALADLVKPSVRLALGSAAGKPGRASRLALQKAGVKVGGALSAGDGAGVIAAVAAWRADAGIVYGSDAGAAGEQVAVVRIPEAQSEPVAFVASLVVQAPRLDLARLFVGFLFTDAGQDPLIERGFQPIECSGGLENCTSFRFPS